MNTYLVRIGARTSIVLGLPMPPAADPAAFAQDAAARVTLEALSVTGEGPVTRAGQPHPPA